MPSKIFTYIQHDFYCRRLYFYLILSTPLYSPLSLNEPMYCSILKPSCMKDEQKWGSGIRLGPFQKQNTWEFQVADQVPEELPPYMPTMFSALHSHRPLTSLSIGGRSHTDSSIFLKLWKMRGRTLITYLVWR